MCTHSLCCGRKNNVAQHKRSFEMKCNFNVDPLPNPNCLVIC